MKNWAKNRSPDVNGQRLLVRAWDGVKDFDGGALVGFPFPWRRPWFNQTINAFIQVPWHSEFLWLERLGKERP